MDVLEHDALALSAAMERGEVSAEELMRATLDRIAAVNGEVNAIVSLRDPADLITEARAADAAPRKGWLHGIPIAIKDLANVAGINTTLGSPLFAEMLAPKDDRFVARLRGAGALIIGKTNTPEFGLGSHTFNPVHGITRNPYDRGVSAGGSSGGAAAALAARMLVVADGSDMMGSLRNPAAWNNVYGMRPTHGLFAPEVAADAFLHHMATTGPMARTPADLAALGDTMSGRTTWHQQMTKGGSTGKGLKLGWLGDWDGAYPMEPGIMELSQSALQQLGALGFEIENVAAPFEAARLWDSWTDLRSFAVASGSHLLQADDEARRHLKSSAIWEIERGLSMSTKDVFNASTARVDWARAAATLFDQFDALILPSAQCWPFEAELEHPAEIAGVKMDTYHRWMEVVVPAGLIGLPVVNLPIGFGANGLPAGVQLIGPKDSDAKLLQMAQVWHQATNWPKARPPVIG